MASLPGFSVYAGPSQHRSFSRIQCSSTRILEKSYGGAAVQGTGRPAMEDALCILVDPSGSQPSFFGVFDGHGGNAVAELLKTSLWPEYKKQLLSGSSDLVQATKAAYLNVDQITLAQPKGFLGALRERGVGGARCGATAATLVLMPPKEDGKRALVAANVGDARIVISRGGRALQLTVDHKPDVEAERKRIESRNPTPKKPLVVKVGDTWRIGGLLSLSRAFGDVYLKDWTDGKPDGARGGFGLTAEPDATVIQDINPDDNLIVLATDGLYDRFSNDEVIEFCLGEAEKGLTPQDIANKLVKMAQQRGSTDDIAAIIVFLTSFK